MAVGCFILALGPFIEIGGTRIDLPYAVLHRLLGNQYRTPMRFMTPAVLALTMVVCLTLDRTVFRWKWLIDRVRAQRALVAGLMMLFIWDYDLLKPFPITVMPDYQAYRSDRAGHRRFCGARTADRGTHAVSPMVGRGEYLQYYAPFHQHPIPSGYLSRLPNEVLDYFYSDPLLGALTLSHGLPPASRSRCAVESVDSRLEHRLCGLASRYAGDRPHQIVWRSAESTAAAGEGGRRRAAGDLQGARQVAEMQDTQGARAIAGSGRCVIGLLLIAFFFRVWQLNDVPPGLHHDEVIIGQVAKDILRGHFGIYFTAGYGHEPLYHYVVAGMFGAIGANAFVLRLTSAFIAMLGLATTYVFVRRIFSPVVAHRHTGVDVDLTMARLLRACGLARHYAAAAHNPDGVLFVESACLDDRRGRRMETSSFRLHPSSFILPGILLGLTLYTYQASRVFPLIFGLFLLFVFVQRWLATRRTSWHYSLLVTQYALRYDIVVFFLTALIVAAPLIIYLTVINPSAEARVADLSGPLNQLRAGNPSEVIHPHSTRWGCSPIAAMPCRSTTSADARSFQRSSGRRCSSSAC